MIFDVHLLWSGGLVEAAAPVWFPAVVPLAAAQGPKPASVNERMLAALEKEPGRIAWPARRWAQVLGCALATVQKTAAWRRVLAARAIDQADRLHLHQEGNAA